MSRARLAAACAYCYAVALLGCDDADPYEKSKVDTAPTLQVSRSLAATSLAPLLPARVTHVAVDSRGAVYWTQEGSDAGANLVFAVGDDGVPGATPLSVPAIGAALGVEGSLSGTIQSLAGGADGGVYFFFNGGSGATTLACLGRFDPQSADIQILADTSALYRASRMGAALTLARGTLVATNDGQTLWLWLRHSDRSILFQANAGAGDGATFELRRPFEEVTLSATTTQPGEPQTLSLTAESQKLGPGPGDSLLLLDVPGGMLRQIDPQTGVATDLVTLMGLSETLSRPTFDSRPGATLGQILLFAGDGPPIPPRSEAQTAMLPLVSSAYEPVLLVIDPPKLVRKIHAREFETSARLTVQSMALQQLVYAGNDEWIGYDAGSGTLLKVRF